MPMTIRSWPSTRSAGTSFRFDFSVSDMDRRGIVSEGVTVNVFVIPEYDEKTDTTIPPEVIALQKAQKLLTSALADLRQSAS